ncbi:MAG: helix-turn-helix domain-containing protein [Deltaproteobacteria bacterium]|nr:helix-turn-helix domain-containing protein [Deltaproteobacteria bacterium]
MDAERLMQKERVIKELISKKRRYSEAAEELGVTPRTIHNYFLRFMRHGPDGLKDRRKGNHRKIMPAEEAAILACKKERPQRSARFIRDTLGLKVSEEAVRLILVRHGLNRVAHDADPV